jgi:hypothetical protein
MLSHPPFDVRSFAMGHCYLKRDAETVRRLTLLVAAVALAALAAGMVSRTPTAQPNPEIHEACRPDRDKIPARDLPGTVNVENCPVGERVITDHGVGTVLPVPGESIYVDSLTATGSQELEVTRYRDGALKLEHVGDESEGAQDEPEISAASSLGECSDRAYYSADRRMESTLSWYFNRRTTPKELTLKVALAPSAEVARTSCTRGAVATAGIAYRRGSRTRERPLPTLS